MARERLQGEEISQEILGGAFRVHRKLGAGFLEKVYENALAIELQRIGFDVRQQEPIPVYYDDQRVGEYFADMLVNGVIICELKPVDALRPEHEQQLVNYLVATGMDFGLLLNFGSSVTVKRKFRRYRRS